MSFIVVDLILLVIFVLLVWTFLRRNKKNVKKEGLFFLYKANWGIKLINYVGNKYKRTIKALSYVSVVLGYLLTAGILYLFYTIVKIYLLHPEVVSQIKVPPIMPLVPYIDKFVTFLPPFYFTYWIVIIALIAIPHEFSHGIFAAYNKVKIKKTGFGFFPFFLPVFLAAFVELDEKVMVKRKNFSQRAILAAGTFANVITAIIAFALLAIFFSLSFSPSGIAFDTYTNTPVLVSSITMINNISVTNPNFEDVMKYSKNATFNFIEANGKSYVGIKGYNEDKTLIALYDNAPAINSGLNGPIMEIDGIKINSIEKLSEELGKKTPGQTVIVKAKSKEGIKDFEIKLGENPEKPGKAWLGVGFIQQDNSRLITKIVNAVSSFKKPNIYYEPRFEIALFVYNLLWWLVLISIGVALMNMLPMGVFDGGRFFYLTVLAITGKESWARKSFKFMTMLFLFILFALMAIWIWGLIK
jgi:membrane-associated protease RseP (regulator of RpoE activity)